jgi:hypothetical protein
LRAHRQLILNDCGNHRLCLQIGQNCELKQCSRLCEGPLSATHQRSCLTNLCFLNIQTVRRWRQNGAPMGLENAPYFEDDIGSAPRLNHQSCGTNVSLLRSTLADSKSIGCLLTRLLIVKSSEYQKASRRNQRTQAPQKIMLDRSLPIKRKKKGAPFGSCYRYRPGR